MGKSKSRRLRKPATQLGNAKATTKLKLISDFSEEFQRLSKPGGPLQISKAATTKQNQLLLLCSALDRARVQGQHDQCQSLCANIRTFLASNLEGKIVSGLAALLNSVCPLLTSTVCATRQAATVVIRILAVKVRPEVFAQHVECLTAHVCSALTACDAGSLHMLDLLQLLLVSAPRLLLCCSEQLLPPFLMLLTAQNKPQRTMMRRLRALLKHATSAVEAPSEIEKQKCRAWVAELKKPCGDSSPAPEVALQRNSSLLVVLAGLVQLCLSPPHGKLGTERRGRSAGISTLWLQVTTVVIGSDEIEALLRYRSLDDGAALQLMGSQLLLLEALHCATAARVTQEWLAAAFEVPLMRLHRLLLPPHASSKPYTPSDQLLRLQLSLLTLSCRCRLYRPSNLDLLTRALCDVLVQLENTPDVTQETATLYQMLFMNTFMWLQDDAFEHSGDFREEFDLTELSSEKKSRPVDTLTPAESARADQLLADAMEKLTARDSSAWSKRILSESQLLRKLPRHDVLRLIPSEHQVIIDPAVADVRARIEEEKARRARCLEDWNTRRQQLASQLFDALLQCKTITEPGTACSLRVLDPVLALLFTRLPESCVMPRLMWWKSVLEEGSGTPPAAAGELVRTAVNYCRFDFPLSCMAEEEEEEEMEEEKEEMEDGGHMTETKKMRTT